MKKVILDPTDLEKLSRLTQCAEICDASGRVVGFFTPAGESAPYEIVDPPTDEELERISQNLDGRPLEDILKELESKS